MSRKINQLFCAIVGHNRVTGRCFLVGDVAVDLKWWACRRCQYWEPEGGVEQIEIELAADEQQVKKGS